MRGLLNIMKLDSYNFNQVTSSCFRETKKTIILIICFQFISIGYLLFIIAYILFWRPDKSATLYVLSVYLHAYVLIIYCTVRCAYIIISNVPYLPIYI